MTPDREKVIRIIDELIFEAQKEPTWKAENALRCLKKELLKEHETANLYKCPNCGTWVSAENVVRCKDCIHRGKSEKCVLAAISDEKGFPIFMLDNRGEWFCADGERRTDDA